MVLSALSSHRLQSKNLLEVGLRSSGRVVNLYLLILESLGSTELVFILIMALVFFGPRKLPQISRSLGKNLAEFRRASEEFKRTWDREVTFEEATSPASTPHSLPEQHSLLDPPANQNAAAPMVSAVAPEEVIARQSLGAEFDYAAEPATSTEPAESAATNIQPPHSPKNDWL